MNAALWIGGFAMLYAVLAFAWIAYLIKNAPEDPEQEHDDDL